MPPVYSALRNQGGGYTRPLDHSPCPRVSPSPFPHQRMTGGSGLMPDRGKQEASLGMRRGRNEISALLHSNHGVALSLARPVPHSCSPPAPPFLASHFPGPSSTDLTESSPLKQCVRGGGFSKGPLHLVTDTAYQCGSEGP